MTTDPFERAAIREEREEIAREWTRHFAFPGRKGGNWGMGGASGMAVAIVVFGIPYLIWGLVRAAYFDFGDPTLPQSIVRFFFDSKLLFSLYTGWMLFLIWAGMITRYAERT